MKLRQLPLAAGVLSVLIVAACGGGGDTTDASAVSASPGTTGSSTVAATPAPSGTATVAVTPAPSSETASDAASEPAPVPSPSPVATPSPSPTPASTPTPTPTPAATPTAGATARILVIGDSMTSGGEVTGAPYRSYRGFLGQQLTNAGYAVDILGSQINTPYDGGDPNHDGYPGMLIGPDNLGTDGNTIYDRVVGANGHATLLGSSVQPDIIVLALGWNSARWRADDAGNQYRTLVQAVQARRPGVKLVLATLSPEQGRDETWTANTYPGYRNVNTMARALANASATDDLVLADLAAGGFVASDHTDAIHWTAAGAQRAAAIIRDAIVTNGLVAFAQQ